MNRQRVRGTHSAARLAEIYAAPHDSTKYVEHDIRILTSANLALALLGEVASLADLSCGDARIASMIRAKRTVLGDFAPGYEITGPIDQTIGEIEPVSLYVCSETLEHLDDPDTVLIRIRSKTQHLLLSTPIDAWGDTNEEHYWAWGREDVEEMMARAGFQVMTFLALDFRPGGSQYCFGVWLCR